MTAPAITEFTDNRLLYLLKKEVACVYYSVALKGRFA